MSSLPCLKDDNVAIGDGLTLTEQGHSQKPLTGQGDEKTGTSDSQTKIQETTKNVQEPVKQAHDLKASQTIIKESTIKQVPDDESEDIKSLPSTSTASIEPVESRQPNPTGSAKLQSSAGRILLKRRRSRISMPTVIEARNVAEEVDSAPPRPSKRRSQKKPMIALFLDSDYPRKK